MIREVFEMQKMLGPAYKFGISSEYHKYISAYEYRWFIDGPSGFFIQGRSNALEFAIKEMISASLNIKNSVGASPSNPHCGDPDCWYCEPYTEIKDGVRTFHKGKPAPKDWSIK